MQNEQLMKAVEIAGSKSALADMIGVSRQRLWTWTRYAVKSPPAEFVIPIEKATGVSRHDLRPDIYPVEENS